MNGHKILYCPIRRDQKVGQFQNWKPSIGEKTSVRLSTQHPTHKKRNSDILRYSVLSEYAIAILAPKNVSANWLRVLTFISIRREELRKRVWRERHQIQLGSTRLLVDEFCILIMCFADGH